MDFYSTNNYLNGLLDGNGTGVTDYIKKSKALYNKGKLDSILKEDREAADRNSPVKEMGNPVTKSLESFKEIGTDIITASDERFDNAFKSPGGFLNYLTLGIPDMVTVAIPDTVKGAFAPEGAIIKRALVKL